MSAENRIASISLSENHPKAKRPSRVKECQACNYYRPIYQGVRCNKCIKLNKPVRGKLQYAENLVIQRKKELMAMAHTPDIAVRTISPWMGYIFFLLVTLLIFGWVITAMATALTIGAGTMLYTFPKADEFFDKHSIRFLFLFWAIMFILITIYG